MGYCNYVEEWAWEPGAQYVQGRGEEEEEEENDSSREGVRKPLHHWAGTLIAGWQSIPHACRALLFVVRAADWLRKYRSPSQIEKAEAECQRVSWLTFPAIGPPGLWLWEWGPQVRGQRARFLEKAPFPTGSPGASTQLEGPYPFSQAGRNAIFFSSLSNFVIKFHNTKIF